MSKPGSWTLGGKAPEPMTWPESTKPPKDVKPSATHTGTDPTGRAIGPAEDHTKEKAVKKAASSK